MNSDKAFAVYALSLTVGITSVVATSILTGIATLPSLLTFVEHASLGLLFRAAYKSLGGPHPLFWSTSVEETTQATALDVPAEVGRMAA